MEKNSTVSVQRIHPLIPSFGKEGKQERSLLVKGGLGWIRGGMVYFHLPNPLILYLLPGN